ncbi:MAG: hypothetical protein RLZZ623_1416 [Actinomycetota bacterium]
MAFHPHVDLLGIRHHGPGSARAVEAALVRSPPDIVLIEGPADANPVLALAGDVEMRPPVALLAYAVDRPELASFSPFATFSPEWVALRWAIDRQLPVRFIDLPAKHMLLRPDAAEQLTLHAAHLSRRPLDPLAELALAAGYDDAERWWEDVVEHRGGTTETATTVREVLDESPFAAIAEGMRALRALYEPSGEPADLVEQRREAHMRAGIRAAVRDGYLHVVVVCGAWHVPALEGALDSARSRRDAALLRGIPKVKTALTWVPWTNRRLASGTGYGAGVTAPGWYHHLYTHAGPDVIARWFSEAAQVLRRADHPVSAADAVEATRLADALAALRGRPLAGLAEVDDAARAVLGHGTDTPMRLISESLVVGTQIGAVPASTPMVPLARSLTAEQRRCRLKPEGAVRTLELDLRRPLDLHRSQLLHRLGLLGVQWGIETEGRSSAGTFRETWTLRWEPELEVQLIEASALGTTVVAACSAAALQRAQSAEGLAELTVLLERCLLARLDGVVPHVIGMLSEQSALSADIARLLETVPPLARTLRYGDVRHELVGAPDAPDAADEPSPVGSLLNAVLVGIVAHIGAALGTACTALDDDASSAMALLIREAQSSLALLGRADLLGTFRAALTEVCEQPRVHGLIQGLCTRLLTDSGLLDADATERRVSRVLSLGTPPIEAAAFVEGFLGSSGTVLVHDPMLLAVLDGWLATLAADAFTDVVPLLRRTFGAFEPAERRGIGERVRTGDDPGAARGLIELDAERVAAALVTVAQLLGVSS